MTLRWGNGLGRPELTIHREVSRAEVKTRVHGQLESNIYTKGKCSAWSKIEIMNKEKIIRSNHEES